MRQVVCVRTIGEFIVYVRFVPQQRSIPVGESKTQVVPHCTVLFVGQVTTGGKVSISVTNCVQTLTFEQQSRASQTPSHKVWQTIGVGVALVVSCRKMFVQHRPKAVGGSKVQPLPH